MVENLVIVESPAKAKTIEKFLGDNFLVKSSFGHIRDLDKKNFGIDIKNNFQPKYIVSVDKKKVVTELKKLAKEAKIVWIASDEDREGEAIAWHLFEELKLKKENTRRIVFHEITKEAILKAVDNPRDIDNNLVNAQQARRILDRLVGFEVSPVLWKKVKPSLSAGRVQSVSVRLIVEREREIIAFKSKSFYKIVAHFLVTDKDGSNKVLKSELPKRFDTKEETLKFLESCKNAEYHIDDIVKKPSIRRPAAPFTTSTLQQEASRKLGFSVSQTMSVAQRLYEAGNITYMRTDSVNLSELALGAAKKEIIDLHGEDYVKIRKYTTKSKGAQEAHEAIRPTYLNKVKVEGESNEKRLYDLIWKRTIASQMSDALLEKTNIKISISTNEEKFVATGEMIKFEGFLKVYLESNDDEEQKQEQSLLPQVNVGDKVENEYIKAVQNFTLRPPRFTEASLVKKLEELGIGRPSTYAPTITTVQNRGYVIKESRDGVQRQYEVLNLVDNTIEEEINTQITGAENKKLFPSDIGMVVTDFLVEHFSNIMNYNFTAEVEKEFDEIALGNLIWHEMLGKFYFPFHENVEKTLETSERSNGERILGDDPKTGKVILVRIGRYGPMAQLGKSVEGDEDEKPKFASLHRDQHLETITLEEAIDLFKLPRDLGLYEDKKVIVAIGRFGPYVRHDGKFSSLQKDVDDPMTIDLERAIVLIEEKREKDRLKHIKSFEEDAEIEVLNGRWGPYVSYQKENYRLAKDIDPKELSYEDCLKIIKDGPQKKKKFVAAKKTTTAKKKAPAKKKVAAKKTVTKKKKTVAKKKE
ncbi:type I DNA topoisomerase [Ancylomarina sp. 16SWW S1-10-2]|uniref:type I DNA topoisomerase n=1 Tax=Ancylomarina sp. 16SWW S1-10-2 TaxID=2499681 RepID=UPI0012AD46F0|nr:type I DNA topoisomerase [Ancylomarina sp. 16SWW S1-10-2]MRT92447.1 type I DNA topoisomerase [Ancylomarina sp. 16SWW S1-10-2]